MSNLGIKARALNYNDIEFISQNIRKKFGINGMFPVNKLEHLVELLGCTFDIRDDIKEEGFTDIYGTVITLREDVYEGLIKNNPRARFTAMHELSHKILHCNNRFNLTRCRSEHIPIYCDPEWQANALAGAMLCPAKDIKNLNMNYKDIMDKFIVSELCAKKRLNAMNKIKI